VKIPILALKMPTFSEFLKQRDEADKLRAEAKKVAKKPGPKPKEKVPKKPGPKPKEKRAPGRPPKEKPEEESQPEKESQPRKKEGQMIEKQEKKRRVIFSHRSLMKIHSRTTPGKPLDEITDEHKRAAILICSRNGKTPQEIIDFTGLPKSTVYLTIQRGTIKDLPRSGRPSTAATPQNVNKVGILAVDHPNLPSSLGPLQDQEEQQEDLPADGKGSRSRAQHRQEDRQAEAQQVQSEGRARPDAL
jgi:hypothetical protein